ncbi:Hpt domain-containing protein [Massilia sp. MS-15]|uniref:Hpt domain-containing protein n=1 Tax=Massilia sp. MS-15 TaxID=2878200 RepID=UPI001CD65AEB|nr:Hpt domain-containing protein [Massilia sp. MS-15]MCA1245919.1 Hpt domain-containing protein [Massilia sp. MS-15]
MEAADREFFTRLATASGAFSAGLPATLARLAALGQDLDPQAPARAAAELQAMLHTMAGSAVTFGYRGLGADARALEQRLRVLTAFETVAARDWAAWVGELNGFVEAARRDPRSLG